MQTLIGCILFAVAFIGMLLASWALQKVGNKVLLGAAGLCFSCCCLIGRRMSRQRIRKGNERNYDMKTIVTIISLLVTASLFGQGPIRQRPGAQPSPDVSPEPLDIADEETIGDWTIKRHTDLMSDKTHYSATVHGTHVQGIRSNDYTFMMVKCARGDWLDALLGFPYLNLKDADFVASGLRTSSILMRFDNDKPFNKKVYLSRGDSAVYFSGNESEQSRWVRRLENREVMLAQLDQYSGRQLFRYDLTDFNKVAKRLRVLCGVR